MQDTNTSHTPGPWQANGAAIEEVAQPSAVIAHVYDDTDGCGVDDTWRANARLIAASPEMLSALKACVDAWGRPGDVDQHFAVFDHAATLIDRIEDRIEAEDE